MLKINKSNLKKELKHLYTLQNTYSKDIAFFKWLENEIFRVKEELEFLENKK